MFEKSKRKTLKIRCQGLPYHWYIDEKDTERFLSSDSKYTEKFLSAIELCEGYYVKRGKSPWSNEFPVHLTKNSVKIIIDVENDYRKDGVNVCLLELNFRPPKPLFEHMTAEKYQEIVNHRQKQHQIVPIITYGFDSERIIKPNKLKKSFLDGSILITK